MSTHHAIGGQTVDAGQVVTSGGIAGTRRTGGEPWQVLLSLVTTGTIQDLVLVMTIAGTTPPWP